MMKFVAIVAFLQAGSAFGQTAVTSPADTLDWRRYAPLAVGDVWEYRHGGDPGWQRWERIEAVGDTLVGTRRYYRLHHTLIDEGGLTRTGTSYSTYDEERARVVERLQASELSDTLRREPGWEPEAGGFVVDIRDLPEFNYAVAFGDAFAYTGMHEAKVIVSGGYGRAVEIGGTAYPTVALKRFDEYDLRLTPSLQHVVYAADVGFVRGKGPGPTWRSELTYARIGEVEYGRSTVSVEEAGAPSFREGVVRVGVYPNPAEGDFHVTYVLPFAATAVLEFYDMLGRRVWTQETGRLPAGTHHATVRPGTSGAGVYHLVLRAAGGRGTALVVLLR